MIIGVAKEIKTEEYRVGLLPGQAGILKRKGHGIMVESGAGHMAGFTDSMYMEKGAEIVSREKLYKYADMILKVKCPLESEYGNFRNGQILFTFLHFDENISAENIEKIISRKVTAIAYEWVIEKGESVLLKPMSEITGVLFALQSMKILMEKKGKLPVGFIKDIPDPSALITGMGRIGTNALRVFLANGIHVTVIEKDSDPEVKIQSANVRFSKGAERTSKETDSLGVAEIGLSNGTWDIVIVRYGYNSYVGSVIVSGDTEIEIELTKNAISEPLAPGLSTGFCLCLSNSGLPVQGIDIFYREATAVSNGYSYSDEYGSFESDQNGLAQFAGFIQGAQYRIWRGQLDWEEDKGVLITVPVADNFELPKHLGSP